MTEDINGADILEAIYLIIQQDGEIATDLECCYQIRDYLMERLGKEPEWTHTYRN